MTNPIAAHSKHRLPPRWRELWTALRRWQRERALAQEVQRHLAEMSEYQLRDIGLSRCDIPAIAPLPRWQRLVADMTAWSRAIGGFGLGSPGSRP